MTAAAAPTILVIGRSGQVARALAALTGPDLRLVCAGREDGLDLTQPATVAAAIGTFQPALLVNAAAYTGVDRAESERTAAFVLNRDGPAMVADLAAAAGLPLIHLSTDYVFDGDKAGPYVEADPVRPVCVYGATKAAGEAAIRARTDDHVILRTAWVYAAGGSNFVRTMLRLADERDEISVVDDQRGNPTAAADIAAAVCEVARTILSGRGRPGVFHLAGAGDTTWFGFASEIFRLRAAAGGRVPDSVRPVTTADYPTPARRPANSRLDCRALAMAYGISLPDWRQSLAPVVAQIVAADRRGS
jgi:dTDP-4-dehydrorhamnose reductase